MAIANDTSTVRNVSGGASDSFSYTCTGSDLILVVCFSNYDTTAGDRQVSGITYNSVALTSARTDDNGTSNGRSEIWYLVGPATGANTLAITYGGTITNSDYCVSSWTGCRQSDQIDTSNGQTVTSDTSSTVAATTNAKGCLVIDAMNGNTGPMSLGGTAASLMDASSSTGRAAYEVVDAIGAHNMVYTTAGNDDYAHSVVAFKPLGQAVFGDENLVA